MALIADICPNCRRITRCQVFERPSSDLGISILGVPVASMAVSSTFFVCCGECGKEFKSRTWDERRSLAPAEAVGMETDQILTLTNPTLRDELSLRQLRSEPRLAGPFVLLEKLKPCSVQKALRASLLRWQGLDEQQRVLFLSNADQCDAAIRFAHAIASQPRPFAMGILTGLLVGVAVGAGCYWGLGSEWGFWSGVAGFASGVSVLSWSWAARDSRWISNDLIPQAEREGIHLGWFVHVLDQGGLSNHVELKDLCNLAGVIESTLAADGRAVEKPNFTSAAATKTA